MPSTKRQTDRQIKNTITMKTYLNAMSEDRFQNGFPHPLLIKIHDYTCNYPEMRWKCCLSGSLSTMALQKKSGAGSTAEDAALDGDISHELIPCSDLKPHFEQFWH